MHDAKAAHRIRAQIEKFSGNLCDGLPKVGARMVREVLYGMQARGSVRLSEIARSLGERTALKKVIERLGRQLERPGLREQVRENLLHEATPLVGEETLLVLDPTDVTKRYARKMEHLTTVRDGSEKKLDTGYWCMTVVAAHRSSAQVIPLYQELYSQDAPDFTSENDEMLEAIRAVDSATGGQGVWVVDRGGDRGHILEPLLEAGRKLLVRLQGDRHLITNPGKRSQKKRSVRDLADSMALPHRQTIVYEEHKQERIRELRFGARAVRLPALPKIPLRLVVVEGLGEHPLMLLTTARPRRSRRAVWDVVDAYLTRWRVEETIRFVKQSYQLEDIRLLRYERLRTMASLVMAAAYFTAVHLGRQSKLKILLLHTLDAAQRIYGIPEFRLYAVADGIKQLLFSSQRGVGPPTVRPGDQFILLPFG